MESMGNAEQNFEDAPHPAHGSRCAAAAGNVYVVGDKK